MKSHLDCAATHSILRRNLNEVDFHSVFHLPRWTDYLRWDNQMRENGRPFIVDAEIGRSAWWINYLANELWLRLVVWEVFCRGMIECWLLKLWVVTKYTWFFLQLISSEFKRKTKAHCLYWFKILGNVEALLGCFLKWASIISNVGFGRQHSSIDIERAFYMGVQHYI